MVNGTLVALMNTLNETRTMTATFDEIPELKSSGPYSVINAWTGENMGCKSGEVHMKLEAHDTAVLIVQDTCGGSYSRRYSPHLAHGSEKRT